MLVQLPTAQSAVVVTAGNEDTDAVVTLRQDAAVPQLADDMILVRTVAVALSPFDTKPLGYLAAAGAIAGMDFAGEVVAIGSKVRTAAHIKVGYRVCGVVAGSNALSPNVGAFAEYVAAADITTIKIPSYMSFEGAASLGSSLAAVGTALFQSLGVPGTPKNPSNPPEGPPINVLVYGGSTATGTLAIQLLKLSGFHVMATCSPHNFSMVRSYGADAVFDYKAPSCVYDIRAESSYSLGFVLDCVSEPETMQFCCACIGLGGGKYTALGPPSEVVPKRKDITCDWVLGMTVLGKELGWPEPFAQEEVSPERREFGVQWFADAQDLLDACKIKPHPLRLVPGGLDGVLYGLEQLRRNKVSGEKLVCRVREASCESMECILAEEPMQGGGKRYLVSYSGADTNTDKGSGLQEDSSSRWVELDSLQGSPQILHNWYKKKWWTT